VQEVAGSYLLGALGGITYLRLLNRSVDSVGADSLGAAAGGAISQPRILIPAILVLVYNRCVLCADEVNSCLQLAWYKCRPAEHQQISLVSPLLQA
jgi:hypothetical protein